MGIIASGDQYDISYGSQQATLVEVGGGIRTYTSAGRPVLEGYHRDQRCHGARGAPLIPWPHRLAGGRYRFGGIDHQLALTEPLEGNAIHGLTRWATWSLRELSDHHVALGYRLPPQPGYPFALHLAITYQLDHHGLTVTTTATNFGDTPCPYGHGQHPYLSPGTTQTHNNANHNNANHNNANHNNANHNNSNHNNATHNNANHNNANHDNGNHTSGNHDSGDGDGVIDDCSLQLDAARVLMLDDRGLPTRSDYVIGSHFDFRHPRRLGDTLIDNIYTELARDTAGRAWVHLRGPHEPNGPDGCTVSLWMDHHYRYVALYTGDTHPPEHHRGGLGVAPMTCGPNGFATGEHLIVLEPGQSVSTQWGIHTRDTASTDPR